MTDKIYFKVIEFRPDRREYQQNSVLMQTAMTVAVELDGEEKGLLDSYDEQGNPILTPAGMAWVMMQVENAILPKVQPATPIDEWVGETSESEGETTAEETTETWDDESTSESSWDNDDEGWDAVNEMKAKKAENTNSNWEEEWDK